MLLLQKAVFNEMKGCQNIQKLLACIDVLALLLWFHGAVRHGSIMQLVSTLIHKYPRVRVCKSLDIIDPALFYPAALISFLCISCFSSCSCLTMPLLTNIPISSALTMLTYSLPPSAIDCAEVLYMAALSDAHPIGEPYSGVGLSKRVSASANSSRFGLCSSTQDMDTAQFLISETSWNVADKAALTEKRGRLIALFRLVSIGAMAACISAVISSILPVDNVHWLQCPFAISSLPSPSPCSSLRTPLSSRPRPPHPPLKPRGTTKGTNLIRTNLS